MKIKNVGLMSPGDMGQALAQQIKQQGYEVFTALDARSARSKALARDAGLTDVGSVAALTDQCEVVLSVMNPGAALEFAGELAAVLAVTKRDILFVDCNAISPVTMQAIAEKITAAGARCADGGIIGPPPRGASKVWLYVSGPDAALLEELATAQLNVVTLSERIGDASSIKMCYGAMTKGVTALVLELLIAARRLGVEEALETQLKETRSDVYDWIIKSLPIMPPKAYRWVPEMHQIAQTFEAAGMTPLMFKGAADMYEFVAETALGKETPENRDKSRDGKAVVKALADELGPRKS